MEIVREGWEILTQNGEQGLKHARQKKGVEDASRPGGQNPTLKRNVIGGVSGQPHGMIRLSTSHEELGQQHSALSHLAKNTEHTWSPRKQQEPAEHDGCSSRTSTPRRRHASTASPARRAPSACPVLRGKFLLAALFVFVRGGRVKASGVRPTVFVKCLTAVHADVRSTHDSRCLIEKYCARHGSLSVISSSVPLTGVAYIQHVYIACFHEDQKVRTRPVK